MAARQTMSAESVLGLPSAKDAPGPALALFDLDRTLLRGSSLLALGHALVDAGLVRRRTLAGGALLNARYRRRGASDADAQRARSRALHAVAGLERSVLREIVDRVGPTLAASVSPGARMLFEHHRRSGDFCVVLSASPQELVESICAALGGHRGIGTRAAVVDDRLTGELEGPFCYGPGKLARLRDALGPVDLLHAWAYADSRSDLPLLEACGHPVAVNPDRTLRRVAALKSWPVLVVG